MKGSRGVMEMCWRKRYQSRQSRRSHQPKAVVFFVIWGPHVVTLPGKGCELHRLCPFLPKSCDLTVWSQAKSLEGRLLWFELRLTWLRQVLRVNIAKYSLHEGPNLGYLSKFLEGAAAIAAGSVWTDWYENTRSFPEIYSSPLSILSSDLLSGYSILFWMNVFLIYWLEMHKYCRFLHWFLNFHFPQAIEKWLLWQIRTPLRFLP